MLFRSGYWLHKTAISVALQAESPWLWPLCETIHFIGLTLLLGVTGYFDLRLLGVGKRVSVADVKEFMPWAIVGFALCAITGVIFFVSEPPTYLQNPAWWPKVVCLVIAGTNALVFETGFGKQVSAMRADDQTPMAFKIIALVSLASWMGVLVFGRMLGFVATSTSADV